MADEVEYGPEGYLPERASRRARKVVLRARMGIQWVIATIVAGVVIVGAGLLWLAQSDEPPGDPWVNVGSLTEFGEAVEIPALDVLVVATGRPRAFVGLSTLDLQWCPASRQIEGSGGAAWSATGRAQSAGSASLEQHPTRVHDGILYVDPTVTAPGPEPQVTDPETACGPSSPTIVQP